MQTMYKKVYLTNKKGIIMRVQKDANTYKPAFGTTWRIKQNSDIEKVTVALAEKLNIKNGMNTFEYKFKDEIHKTPIFMGVTQNGRLLIATIDEQAFYHKGIKKGIDVKNINAQLHAKRLRVDAILRMNITDSIGGLWKHGSPLGLEEFSTRGLSFDNKTPVITAFVENWDKRPKPEFLHSYNYFTTDGKFIKESKADNFPLFDVDM